MSKVKKVPEFASEAEERKFWESHDSTECVDWSQAEAVLMPNLKPSTKTISHKLEALLCNEGKKRGLAAPGES